MALHPSCIQTENWRAEVNGFGDTQSWVISYQLKDGVGQNFNEMRKVADKIDTFIEGLMYLSMMLYFATGLTCFEQMAKGAAIGKGVLSVIRLVTMIEAFVTGKYFWETEKWEDNHGDKHEILTNQCKDPLTISESMFAFGGRVCIVILTFQAGGLYSIGAEATAYVTYGIAIGFALPTVSAVATSLRPWMENEEEEFIRQKLKDKPDLLRSFLEKGEEFVKQKAKEDPDFVSKRSVKGTVLAIFGLLHFPGDNALFDAGPTELRLVAAAVGAVYNFGQTFDNFQNKEIEKKKHKIEQLAKHSPETPQKTYNQQTYGNGAYHQTNGQQRLYPDLTLSPSGTLNW